MVDDDELKGLVDANPRAFTRETAEELDVDFATEAAACDEN